MEREKRTAPSGITSVVYRGHSCKLLFVGVEGNSMSPGRLEHEKEKIFAPKALVQRDGSKWRIEMTMPKVAIGPDTWPRLQQAVEDMLSFWHEFIETEK